MIKKFFKWIFKSELNELNAHIQIAKENNSKFQSYKKTIDSLLENIDVSVDVHQHDRYSRSWAVISLQGKKSDYVKFVDLGDSDIRHIQQFLRQFERNSNIKIDAAPDASKWLRIIN